MLLIHSQRFKKMQILQYSSLRVISASLAPGGASVAAPPALLSMFPDRPILSDEKWRISI